MDARGDDRTFTFQPIKAHGAQRGTVTVPPTRGAWGLSSFTVSERCRCVLVRRVGDLRYRTRSDRRDPVALKPFAAGNSLLATLAANTAPQRNPAKPHGLILKSAWSAPECSVATFTSRLCRPATVRPAGQLAGWGSMPGPGMAPGN
jgi:hypothetical protein